MRSGAALAANELAAAPQTRISATICDPVTVTVLIGNAVLPASTLLLEPLFLFL
jgi:hypothetical protein